MSASGRPRGDELSRRDFMYMVGAFTLAFPTVSALRSAVPSRLPAETIRAVGWTRHRTIVSRSCRPLLDRADCFAQNTLWATLMRVDTKLSNPLDSWYLWHWTHDNNVCRLYTARKPEGPFTERECSIPDPPRGYLNEAGRHGLSSGDVVWDDPVFYATPHAAKLPRGTGQDTFLLRSSDGRDWDYVSDEPILAHTGGETFDSRGANYGRVLRDLDGNAVKVAGHYIIYYRGVAETGADKRSRFMVGAARSRDWRTWTKLNSGRALFDPADGALHALGSAIWQPDDRTVSLVLSVREDLLQSSMYLKSAAEIGGPSTWSDEPGDALMLRYPEFFSDGGSYTVDRASDGGEGFHYMACASSELGPGGALSQTVELLKHPTPSTAA